MTVFDFNNYKDFVIKRIESMPKRGHGQFRKMAIFLSINSVNVTQIFRGARDLTTEQACMLCEFFGLSDLEGQFFVSLVEYERASHHKLKQMIRRRLDEILEKSLDLKQRLRSQGELTEETKAIFYSAWYYSAIRLACSVPELRSVDTLAKYFNLPLSTVNRTIEFLINTGLCKEIDGRLAIGPSATHLEASSPLITRHHTNWRMKAVEKMERLGAEELCLSMPCSLSEKSIKHIRKELVECIEKITQHIDASPEEKLACLNIDWFKI